MYTIKYDKNCFLIDDGIDPPAYCMLSQYYRGDHKIYIADSEIEALNRIKTIHGYYAYNGFIGMDSLSVHKLGEDEVIGKLKGGY